jgi:four helix bundle protein
MGVARFEDLRVWQEARRLSDELAPILAHARFDRDPRLRSQLADAVASVMANIAEGFVRRRRKEFAQFVRVAAGSNAELRSHLHAATGRGYLESGQTKTLIAHSEGIGRMLRRLLDYLESDQAKQHHT